jgi:MFS family permease
VSAGAPDPASAPTGRIDRLLRGGPSARPDFRRLWAAQSVSVFGTLISRTAIPWLAILVLDATAWQVAALGLADMVPAFALGLVAGAWVDRLPRKPIMVIADVGRAALLLAVPALAWAGALRFEALLVIVALVSVLTVFFDVAYQAMLPAVVPEDELLEANSRLSATSSVAEVSAFSISGWLTQALTAPGAIFVDALTFIWSALTLRGLRAEERPTPPEGREPLRAEIGAGLALVWRTPALRTLAGYGMTVDLGFRIYGTVFMIYVTRDLGFSPGPLGMIFALGGLAALGGAAMVGRVDARLGMRAGVVVMTLAMAVGQGGVALATAATVFAVALLIAQQFLVDGPYTVVDIMQSTIRQTSAPVAWQGRVTATLRVLSFGAAVIGSLLGGYLGDAFGARTAVVVAAGIVALGAVWGLGLRPGSIAARPAAA